MAELKDNRRFYGVDWRGGIFGGLVGGLLWLLIVMASAVMVGLHVWEPLQYIGALLQGPAVAADGVWLMWGAVLLGLVLHLFFSVLYAFVLGAYVRFHSTGRAVLAGGIYGLLLYVINFHIFAPVFSWFEALLNPGTVLAHLVYGLVAGWVYIRVEQVGRRGAAVLNRR